MPPRDDELPEGTDRIINGAMETGGDDDGGGAKGGGGASSGFIGASGGDGTGGTTAPGGGNEMTATEGTGDLPAGGGLGGDMTGGGAASGDDAAGGGVKGSGNVTDQVKGQIYNLRDQAGGKVREFADTGKTRATDMLEELSRVVADTADSIDERLGNNYGEYARKAADGVSGFAESLRGKDVDELYDNVRSAVRKSPGLAIGIAAVVGFTLVRLVKAGLPDEDEGTGGGGTGRRASSGGTGA